MPLASATVGMLLLAVALPLPAQEADHTTDRTIPVRSDRERLLRPPDGPLDARVRGDAVTESDPPPLPDRVVLPVPPTFRLATSPDEVPISDAHWRKAQAVIDRGVAFLERAQQTDSGWLSDAAAAPSDQPQQPSPVAVAVTAMALKAIAQARPEQLKSESFLAAVRFVHRAQAADGSFDGGALTNYVTSAVVSALAAFQADEYRGSIQDAVTWLQQNQWDQGEGLSARQDWFGGAGYGDRGRPDLSNTQMMLDALHDAGVSPDEPSVQRALAFISRAQNLKATNPSDWAGDDGGFIYTPANGGESMASEAAGDGRKGELIADGRPRSLRSYGSMTYAGFKSMIWAGLSPDDVRVRAAFDWIRRHWTFDENPGLGEQGLYYYYHTMARALAASQQHQFDDIDGAPHNWREELIDALAERQRGDGSWVNEADRWLEGEPVMATIHALLALEEALKPVLQVE